MDKALATLRSFLKTPRWGRWRFVGVIFASAAVLLFASYNVADWGEFLGDALAALRRWPWLVATFLFIVAIAAFFTSSREEVEAAEKARIASEQSERTYADMTARMKAVAGLLIAVQEREKLYNLRRRCAYNVLGLERDFKRRPDAWENYAYGMEAFEQQTRQALSEGLRRPPNIIPIPTPTAVPPVDGEDLLDTDEKRLIWRTHVLQCGVFEDAATNAVVELDGEIEQHQAQLIR